MKLEDHETLFYTSRRMDRRNYITVSSLRLDTVIASIFNISRQKASMLIHGGKVKVNWTERESAIL